MKPETIVRTYIRKIRPLAQAEIDWFIQQPSLDAAIEKAALAVNSRGKRYSHQRRLKMAALKRALGALLDKSGAIRKARDFDELFNLVGAAVTSITGIGELYVYDTSLRIGVAPRGKVAMRCRAALKFALPILSSINAKVSG